MGIGNVTECVYVMVYGLGCMRVFHNVWIGVRFLVYVWANYHIILVTTFRLLVNNIIKVNNLGTIHHCYCIRLYILGLVLVSNVNH